MVLMVGACGLFKCLRRKGETLRATLHRLLRKGQTPALPVELVEGAVDLESKGPPVDQIALEAAAKEVLADVRADAAGPVQPDEDTPPVVINVDDLDLNV